MGATKRVERADAHAAVGRVPTPECARLSDVRSKSQVCGAFLEWLEQEKGWHLPAYNMQQLLAEYFDIDLNKVETERRALLAALGKANEA